MPKVVPPLPIELAEQDEVIAPQPGPQTMFMQSAAQVIIYGGAAGGGKTRGLLIRCARDTAVQPVRGTRAVVFRRTYTLITQPGGIWDESHQVYSLLGGKPVSGQKLAWKWAKHDTEIVFAHMQFHPKDTYAKKGLQAELIGFEELTEFEEEQFFYMLSRNRSRSGVKPQLVATTNPEYDSWVRIFLAPWIDPEYPEPAQSGELRYFFRGDDDRIHWLPKGKKHKRAYSATFIAASIEDNKILRENDPEYEIRLMTLPLVERLKLRYGDWQARKISGKVYKRHWFPIVEVPFTDIVRWVRFWDLAATEDERVEQKNKEKGGPDFTASCLVGITKQNVFIVLHATWDRFSPLQADEAIQTIASQDGRIVAVAMEQEPGATGKRDLSHFRRNVLPEYEFRAIPGLGNKLERSRIPSTHVEARNVYLLRGEWNEGFLNFLEAFPNPKVHDDVVDAFNGAMLALLEKASKGGIVTYQPVQEEAQERQEEAQQVVVLPEKTDIQWW